MNSIASLILTGEQVQTAIKTLDGYHLPQRTLSLWAKQGVVTPTVRHDGIRGRFHPRIYNLSDLARCRLVVRMRRAGISMSRTRVTLAMIDVDLRAAFHPATPASLIVDGLRCFVVANGLPARELPSGQFRLQLDQCFVGTLAEARRLTA